MDNDFISYGIYDNNDNESNNDVQKYESKHISSKCVAICVLAVVLFVSGLFCKGYKDTIDQHKYEMEQLERGRRIEEAWGKYVNGEKLSLEESQELEKFLNSILYEAK